MPQGYDLIWKGCEITTGAQREHRYEVLKAQADEKGLGEALMTASGGNLIRAKVIRKGASSPAGSCDH